MSRRVYRTNLGEHANDVPLVFANEPKVAVGKGGAAFKSLTAAVRAAEREKEEARGFKVATEQVLDLSLAKLREVRKQAEEFKAFVVRWCWVFAVLLLLNAVVCAGYFVERFFP